MLRWQQRVSSNNALLKTSNKLSPIATHIFKKNSTSSLSLPRAHLLKSVLKASYISYLANGFIKRRFISIVNF